MAKTIVTVDQGGTGAQTLTDGGVLLGSGVGAVTATAVLADGEMLVGDGAGDPVLESGATLRTSIGVDVPVTLASVTGNYLVLSSQEITAGTVPLTLGGTGATTAGAALTALGAAGSGVNSDITSLTGLTTALTAAQGGTGAASYTVGDILFANTTTTLAKLAASTDGYVLTATGAGTAPAWEASAGGGNVSNVATPVDNQVAIWKTSTTIEGDADLVFDGSQLGIGMNPGQKLTINTEDGAGYLGFYVGEVGKSYIGCSTAAHSPIAEMVSGDLGIRVNGGALFLSTDSGLNGHLIIDSAGRVTVKKASNSKITALVDVADTETVVVDFDDADNFSLLFAPSTSSESRVLGTPSNLTAGQSGCIVITQDDTDTVTMTYTSAWHFEGGTDPTLSTAADAVDTLVYYCPTASVVQAVLLKDLK